MLLDVYRTYVASFLLLWKAEKFAALRLLMTPVIIRRLCTGCLLGTLSDILTDLDDRIFSATLGMRSKKVSKLHPYPRVRSRKYYRFEG